MNIASLKSGDFSGLISQFRLVRFQYSQLELKWTLRKVVAE